MKIRTLLSASTTLALLLVAACSSSTDLTQVSVQGSWDSVGALQNVSITVPSQNTDGSFTGSWRLSNGGTRFLADGMNTAGNVQFTLAAHPEGNLVFQGRFTDEYRLEGTLSGINLSGPAVFRRSSF